jgi:hypothetical protein
VCATETAFDECCLAAHMHRITAQGHRGWSVVCGPPRQHSTKLAWWCANSLYLHTKQTSSIAISVRVSQHHTHNHRQWSCVLLGSHFNPIVFSSGPEIIHKIVSYQYKALSAPLEQSTMTPLAQAGHPYPQIDRVRGLFRRE